MSSVQWVSVKLGVLQVRSDPPNLLGEQTKVSGGLKVPWTQKRGLGVEGGTKGPRGLWNVGLGALGKSVVVETVPHF